MFLLKGPEFQFVNCNNSQAEMAFICLCYFFQCVFEVNKDKGLTLTELWPGVSIQDVQVSTGCNFEVSPEFPPSASIGCKFQRKAFDL